MQKASDTIECRRLFAFCDVIAYDCSLRRLGSGSAAPSLAPAFVTALTAISHLFLPRVELRALLSGQDVANLRRLLGPNGLTDLAGLLHVAAERSGVALLASRARSVDERLGLGARRSVLRLILLTDRLDLRLLGVSQVEIGEDRKSTRLNSSHRCISY